MKSLLIIIFLGVITGKFCAAQYMQVVRGNGVYSGVHQNDMLLLSQSEVANTNNADITGDPFWNDDWKMAILYTGDLAILVPKVKLNQYSNDVWYTTADSVVMIAKKGKVTGITFFKGNDTTNVLANFVYLKNGDGDNRYYQLMNTGKAQLIKLTTVTINKALFDPFNGKAEQKYVAETGYYLYYNSKITLLKGKNKETIFELLQPNDSSEEWLDKNKNKLKSESDILLFLDYFNAQNHS